MYNGIGLETPRGSGTNGYVQRNLAFVRNRKEQVDYKDEDGLKDWELQLTRRANPELIEHERKRKVELKCAEMHELMEEQGYGEEEIESKVSQFRKMLLEKLKAGDSVDDEKDKNGKPMNEGAHMKLEAAGEKNRKLREAFGIGEFDKKALKEKREAERIKVETGCKKAYETIDDDDDDAATAAAAAARVASAAAAAAAVPSEKVKKSKKSSKEADDDEPAHKKKKKDKSNKSPSEKEKKKKKKKHKHASREREHRREKDRR